VIDRLEELLFLLPILLVSMMFHEVSHGLVAYRLGDPTARAHGRLTLNPVKHLDPLGSLMFVLTFLSGFFVFGWAKPVPINPRYFKSHKKGMMAVGLAGPAANFAMAVVLAVIMTQLASDQAIYEAFLGGGELWLRVLTLAYQVNIVLGIFNLAPIPPLDGSRIVGGFLPDELSARWSDLDRYGFLFILLVFIFFRGPFFRVLSEAFALVSRVLMPGVF
jgi:Zn-dependent protease